MKNLILNILIITSLLSCNNEVENNEQMYDVKHNKIHHAKLSQGIHIIEVDGCEYILYVGHKKGGITHKENCNNPEHNTYENY